MSEPEHVVLVDGNNIVMRSLYAARGVEMSSSGVNTGPLVVFINMLSRFFQELEPDRVLVAFDGSDVWRKSRYPEYKAARKKAPDDERDSTFDLVRAFLEASEVAAESQIGLEADDLIAWAWQRERGTDSQVTIISGDKDLLQLVEPGHTKVVRPGSGPLDVWGIDRVREKFKTEPKRLPQLMALTGDTSDGIPGVPGVGPVKAKKLLDEHHWDLMGLIDAQFSRGAWTAEQAALAKTSHLLVNLRDADYNRLVHDSSRQPLPQGYPIDPRQSGVEAFARLWGLEGLVRKVENRTLWRSAHWWMTHTEGS